MPGISRTARRRLRRSESVAALVAALIGIPPALVPWPSGRADAAPGGPVVTFTGFARANGTLLLPVETTPEGPLYRVPAGTGFFLVIEGGAGTGTETFSPDGLPNVQVQATEPLGNGSGEVCDDTPPLVGGVPAISPPDLSFANAGAINDFACRFDPNGCLVGPLGDPMFANPSSAVQFCARIDSTLAFQSGETLITMRVSSADGTAGPIVQMRLQVGDVAPTATPTGAPVPTSTAVSSTPTRTPTPSLTAVQATATPSASATNTAPSGASPTQTAPATATRTARNLPDLESVIHAIFSPEPPTATDLNGDQTVGAADLTELVRLLLE